MQSLKMALAIFWLPLIAGVLLGGLAAAAWYGGDKTLAIWMGFIGTLCFALTAALQAQQYVWVVANQPQISLVPTEERSFLRWDPPTSYQMQSNDIPNPEYGSWKAPVLRIRNAGVVAQDATIKWAVTPYEVQALVDSAPRLKGHKTKVEPNRITLGPETGSGSPFMHPLEWSTSLPIAFITRETSTFIPLTVWEHAALFFIATLADEPKARSAPFFFDAQISWNIPEGGQAKRFRVKVTAENAKLSGIPTPLFLANIYIEATEEK
jgi:hypothetical protein